MSIDRPQHTVYRGRSVVVLKELQRMAHHPSKFFFKPKASLRVAQVAFAVWLLSAAGCANEQSPGVVIATKEIQAAEHQVSTSGILGSKHYSTEISFLQPYLNPFSSQISQGDYTKVFSTWSRIAQQYDAGLTARYYGSMGINDRKRYVAETVSNTSTLLGGLSHEEKEQLISSLVPLYGDLASILIAQRDLSNKPSRAQATADLSRLYAAADDAVQREKCVLADVSEDCYNDPTVRHRLEHAYAVGRTAYDTVSEIAEKTGLIKPADDEAAEAAEWQSTVSPVEGQAALYTVEDVAPVVLAV
jgi:hypothetical protein